MAIDLVPFGVFSLDAEPTEAGVSGEGLRCELLKFPAMRLAMRALYRLALHHLRIPVISVSDSLTKTLQQFLPYKILTAPNGVDTGFFQKHPAKGGSLKTRAKR